MIEHVGPGHADITLSLTGETTDGAGRWYQSWTVCECGLGVLVRQLGPPHYEAMADAESVHRVADFVWNDPGHMSLGPGEQQ
jgi:hypothetical protein